MKLNIGSSTSIKGKYSSKDWVNIDIVAPGDPLKLNNYIRCSALDLCFKENTFEEVRAIHCLEHIPRKDHELFYKEIYRVLKPGGVVFIEVPNFIKICALIVDCYREENWEQMRIWTTSVYGKNRHAGDKHYWGFSEEILTKDLEKQGFEVEPQSEMISEHWKQEPVLLIKAYRGV